MTFFINNIPDDTREALKALENEDERTLYLVERDCLLPICDIHRREECSKELFANLIGELNDCIGKIKAK